ncbi:MAG: TonB family protein [Chitinivibrionales bacterium]|nr:TonB family protein [Chitinivibrionales bacterium]
MAQVQQTGIFFGATATVSLGDFPRQLRGGFTRHLDRRFLVILSSVAVVIVASVGFSAFRSIPETVTNEQILKVQERYATLVLNQPKKQVTETIQKMQLPPKATPLPQKKEDMAKKESAPVDRKNESMVERTQRKEATVAQRKQVRQEIQKQVQTSGIFAAITATSSGSGRRSTTSAVDLLSSTVGVDDFSTVAVSGKGSFVKRETQQALVSQPRGEKTTGVTIAKEQVGTAEQKQIASSGSVSITSEAPQVSGQSAGKAFRSQADINQVVLEQQGRLKKIYEAMLKRDPSLKGKLLIRFTILVDGTVAEVSIVSSTTNNQTFDQRIVSFVERWKFPAVAEAGPVEVVFPFVFTGYQS